MLAVVVRMDILGAKASVLYHMALQCPPGLTSRWLSLVQGDDGTMQRHAPHPLHTPAGTALLGYDSR